MKNKTQKIITTIVLAGIVFANFAFAQTTSAVCLGAPPQGLTTNGVDPNSSAAACAAAGGTWQAPGSTFNVTLKLADDIAAQANQQACEGTSPTDANSYKYKIVNMTQGAYKATWVAAQAPYTNGQDGKLPCRIVTYNSKDGTISFNTTGAANLQAAIRFSANGVSSSNAIAAAASDASAQASAGSTSNLIGWVINAIFLPFNAALGMLTAIAGGIFANVLQYTLQVTSMPTIVTLGWGIVRDICNMFFILILIVIALAAILRIESYDYRHLLAEVVIMALLVNFSMVIAVTLMNFTNLIVGMFTFQGGMAGLKEVFSFVLKYVGQDISPTSINGGPASALVQSITKMIFSLVSLSAFLALAGLFVVRLVGIYVLVILSPIAYVLDILPSTKHFAHEWWQTFIKYLIWAPVALFFVRLAVNLAQSPIPQINDSAFEYIILMAFMWAAVIVAEHAGMVGGQAVINGAEHAGHKVFETGDMWLARQAKSSNPVRRSLSYFSVGAAQKGLAMRLKKKEHESYNQAAAQRADQFSKVLSGGFIPGITGDKTEFRKRAMIAEWNDEKKLNLTSDQAELKHINDEGIETKNSGEVAGSALKLAEDGNINGLVGGTTALHLQKYIDKLVEKNVMKKQDAYQLGMLMSNAAQENGQYNLAKAFVGDGHGGVRKTDDDERNAMLIGMGKKGSQQDHDRRDGRLATGFDIEDEKVFDINNQPVMDPVTKEQKTQPVIKDLMPHGEKAIENINSYTDHAQNGNKETKLFRMLGASQTTFKNNREAWAVEANEFLGKRPEQITEAYKVADASKERVLKGERLDMVWDDNLKKAVVDPEHRQLKLNVEQLIQEEIILPEDFQVGKGRFRHLVKYAPPEYQRGGPSTNTRPPQNPPAPSTSPNNPSGNNPTPEFN